MKSLPMVKCLLVEDEQFAYEELKRMMGKIRPAYHIAGRTESIEDTADFLKRHPIDLLFLDICLSDGLCFELFGRNPLDVPVIFTTAYDEYALKAFKMNSVDYLLKPIGEEELEAALCKFEHFQLPRLASGQCRDLSLTYMQNAPKNRFLVRLGENYQYVDTQDVAFFYSEDKAVYLHTFSGRRYVIDYTLEQLEQLLDKNRFFRVSRNCIPNLKAVKKVSRYFSGRFLLALSPECPQKITVSRIRSEDFLKWMDDTLYPPYI